MHKSNDKLDKPYVSLGDRPIEEQEAFWAAMKGLKYEDMTPEEQDWYRVTDTQGAYDEPPDDGPSPE
jgi:hypothetical protein